MLIIVTKIDQIHPKCNYADWIKDKTEMDLPTRHDSVLQYTGLNPIHFNGRHIHMEPYNPA